MKKPTFTILETYNILKINLTEALVRGKSQYHTYIVSDDKWNQSNDRKESNLLISFNLKSFPNLIKIRTTVVLLILKQGVFKVIPPLQQLFLVYN